MNIVNPNLSVERVSSPVSQEDADAALAVLSRWSQDSQEKLSDSAALYSEGFTSRYPEFSRSYPHEFKVDKAYIATLPDLQNGPSSLIRGSNAPIQHVGISNFRLPVRYFTKSGDELRLETSVTGTVSLEAEPHHALILQACRKDVFI